MTMNRFHSSSSLTALSQSLGIVLLLLASQLVSCGTIDLPDEPKPIEKPHKVTIHTRAVTPESVVLPIEVVAFSEGGQYVSHRRLTQGGRQAHPLSGRRALSSCGFFREWEPTLFLPRE